MNIGLSLGADICWPIGYEELIDSLELDFKLGGDRLRFQRERVTIEPFDLAQPMPLRRGDRPADALVFDQPRMDQRRRSCSTTSTSTTTPGRSRPTRSTPPTRAMMRLGLPVPETWMIPPKAYEHGDDLEQTLRQYARLFSFEEVGRKIGYPFFMKPYDGGGWRRVTKIDDLAALPEGLRASGTA